MRPFCVGLTGGIGAGKSTVANIFAGLGATVVDTDVISRGLTCAGGRAMADIARVFGSKVIAEDGSLDRPSMRALVFADSHSRKQLEVLLHPLILDEARKQVHATQSAYALLVVPLLVEHMAEYGALLDRILLVDCDEAQQLQRIMARPGVDLVQAKAMLAAQSTREDRRAIADDVIDNRGDIEQLSEQVGLLHRQYLTLAGEKNSH